jgi:hypothetical protein
MKINFAKDAKISIYNPAFDVMRNELDINLNGVIAEMVEKDMSSGSVTLKIEVTTSKDIINDDNAPMGTRPAMNIEIDADVSSVIQKKGKTKVDVITRGHQKELVMDDNGQFFIVSREEASGQLSMFNSYDEYKKAMEDGTY